MMKKVAFLGSVALLALAGLSPAHAQFRAALDESRAAVDEGARSQQAVEALDDQAAELLGDYRAALKQRDILRRYNATRAKQVQDQAAQIAGLEQDVANVADLQRAVLPLLETMVDDLAKFVAADLPFLTSERNDRIERLRRVMADSTQTPASRYGLIIEAYQIESEYGRTIETYTGSIDNGGQELQVDFLKIGRLALIYKNSDNSIMRIYNKTTGQFEDLDRKYLPDVVRGIRIANKQLPPDLLTIPVGAPETVEAAR